MTYIDPESEPQKQLGYAQLLGVDARTFGHV